MLSRVREQTFIIPKIFLFFFFKLQFFQKFIIIYLNYESIHGWKIVLRLHMNSI